MKNGATTLRPKIRPVSGRAMRDACVSLTPRFSGVELEPVDSVNRFNGLSARAFPRHERTVRTARNTAESGSILMITVIAACLLGLTLGSYLLMVRAEGVSVARSQSWNAALTVASAGVEEALAALNQNAAGRQIDRPPPDLSASGWVRSNTGYGPLSRDMTASSFTNGSYSIVVTTDSPPIIYSTGYVTVPAISARISRVIRVATTNAALFTVAAAARTNLILAYSVDNLSDSFDSAVAPYLARKPPRANGALACLYGTVDIGYRQALGDVLLGPTAQIEANEIPNVTGSIRNDFNSDFPDITVPSKVGWMNNPPGALTNSTGTYKYGIATSCDYDISSLNGSVYVGPTANVRVATSGNTTISNLYIAGGGKLTIFMSGANFSLTGNMTVESGNSTNFCYFGLPGNSTVQLPPESSGTTNFFGTIYAPQANLTRDASYGYDLRLIGSFVARSINLVGWVSFHFDENLPRVGPRRGYIVTSWQEM